MTRTMYDGINTDAAKIPTTAELVAGYVDGLYAWSAADWARFPNSVKVRIAVFSTTNDGEVLDCEPGNCTPAQSVDWVLMRRAAGVDPTVYCNELDPNVGWPAVRAAFRARGVPEPHYWVANYSGGQQIPAGAIALQYTDTGSFDLSAVADYWPGIDPTQEEPMTPDEMATLAQLIENRKVGVIASPVADQIATSLGVETASNPARWTALNQKLDALAAAVKAIGTPPPAQVDLTALEALIEQHLASGSVPGVIAVAVAKHLGADLAAG